VVNRAREAWGGFYSPSRESSRLGIRNPDMSDQPLWNPATKPDMAKRSDMSDQSLWNPAMRPDMSG
jgi:hypothetical protein